ncbi:unnamed protein product, partial [Mesorhabditis spiculigera]
MDGPDDVMDPQGGDKVPDVPNNPSLAARVPPHDEIERIEDPVLEYDSPAEPSGSRQKPAPAQNFDKFVQRVNALIRETPRSAAANPLDYSELAAFLKSNEDLLLKRAGDLEAYLTECDSATHGAPIIYALYIMYESGEKKNSSAVKERCFEILFNYLSRNSLQRGQVMVVIDIYVRLFRKAHDFVLSTMRLDAGLELMALGIDLIVDRETNTLTTLHGYLFYLALQAHKPERALPYLFKVKNILNENLVRQTTTSNVTFSTSQSIIEPKSVLMYLRYGGEVAFALGDYKTSAAFYYSLITFPSNDVSPLMIAGHRHWVILEILLDEDTPLHARSACMSRAWRQEGVLYNRLASASRIDDARKELARIRCGIHCHPTYLTRVMRIGAGHGSYYDDEGLSMIPPMAKDAL